MLLLAPILWLDAGENVLVVYTLKLVRTEIRSLVVSYFIDFMNGCTIHPIFSMKILKSRFGAESCGVMRVHDRQKWYRP